MGQDGSRSPLTRFVSVLYAGGSPYRTFTRSVSESAMLTHRVHVTDAS